LVALALAVPLAARAGEAAAPPAGAIVDRVAAAPRSPGTVPSLDEREA